MNDKYTERLLKGLDFEPQKFQYKGEYIDLGTTTGSCACGHEIRYEFTLRHKETNKAVVVGSSCVKNFKFLDEETRKSIINDMKK